MVDKASVSPWMVDLAKTLYVGEANLYSECLFQQEQNITLSVMKMVHIFSLPPGSWLIIL